MKSLSSPSLSEVLQLHRNRPLFEKHLKQMAIQRYNGTVVDIVTHLPTNASAGFEHAHALGDDLALTFDIHIKRIPALVGLPDVVGR